MDYKRPKHDLDFVKKLIDKNQVEIRRIALRDALVQFSFNREQIKDTLLELKRSHFYKSMDSDINYKIRQDVYHFPYKNGYIYIKFQLSNTNQIVIIVTSFKEK